MSDKIREAFAARFQAPIIARWNVDKQCYYTVHGDAPRRRVIEMYNARWEAWQAALAQQPAPAAPVVAWRNFDGEGGYDYTDDEETANRWSVNNGAKYVDWLEPLYAAPPAAKQSDTVSDLGLRHTAPWDSARVGDYNAGWNDRHMAGMRDGEQPDTAKVDHRNIAELLLSIGWKDSSDAQWDRLRNAIPELRALLAGGDA